MSAGRQRQLIDFRHSKRCRCSNWCENIRGSPSAKLLIFSSSQFATAGSNWQAGIHLADWCPEAARLQYAELMQHAITVELEKGMDGMFSVGVDEDGNDKVVRTIMIIPGRCQCQKMPRSFCLLPRSFCPAARSGVIKPGMLFLSINFNRSLGMLCEKLHRIVQARLSLVRRHS